MTDEQRIAMIAAEAATVAAGELLRFAREGAATNLAFGLEDPIAQLTEALQKTIQIEDAFMAILPSYAAERECAAQLSSALAKWQTDAGAS